MTSRYTLLFALLGACALGCKSPSDFGPPKVAWHRVVGTIDGGSTATPLVVPDTAAANSSIALTVSTYGSSCIHPAGAELDLGTVTADITPYDSVPSGPPCLPDWWAFPRSVAVLFRTPGTVTISLHGQGPLGPVVIQKQITIVD